VAGLKSSRAWWTGQDGTIQIYVEGKENSLKIPADVAPGDILDVAPTDGEFILVAPSDKGATVYRGQSGNWSRQQLEVPWAPDLTQSVRYAEVIEAGDQTEVALELPGGMTSAFTVMYTAAAGNDFTEEFSANGTRWTAVAVDAQSKTDLFGGDAGGNTAYWVSDDGQTWSPVALADESSQPFTFGTPVVVDGQFSVPVTYRTDDGVAAAIESAAAGDKFAVVGTRITASGQTGFIAAPSSDGKS
jgi:hypothetical protein